MNPSGCSPVFIGPAVMTALSIPLLLTYPHMASVISVSVVSGVSAAILAAVAVNTWKIRGLELAKEEAHAQAKADSQATITAAYNLIDAMEQLNQEQQRIIESQDETISHLRSALGDMGGVKWLEPAPSTEQ